LRMGSWPSPFGGSGRTANIKGRLRLLPARAQSRAGAKELLLEKSLLRFGLQGERDDDDSSNRGGDHARLRARRRTRRLGRRDSRAGAGQAGLLRPMPARAICGPIRSTGPPTATIWSTAISVASRSTRRCRAKAASTGSSTRRARTAVTGVFCFFAPMNF